MEKNDVKSVSVKELKPGVKNKTKLNRIFKLLGALETKIIHISPERKTIQFSKYREGTEFMYFFFCFYVLTTLK